MEINLVQELANFLQISREKRGMKQKEVALACDLSRYTIVHAERGEGTRGLNFKTACKIMKVLEVDFGDFHTFVKRYEPNFTNLESNENNSSSFSG